MGKRERGCLRHVPGSLTALAVWRTCALVTGMRMRSVVPAGWHASTKVMKFIRDFGPCVEVFSAAVALPA